MSIWSKSIVFVLFAIIIMPSVYAVKTAPAPKNVARAPVDAVRVGDGMSFIVLKAAQGEPRLAQKQYIKSLSTAWTSIDGKTQFNAEEDGIDVSDPHALVAMAPGLAKALMLTPIGEKRRWWITAENMVPGWAGMTPGHYTIDIEVLDEVDPLPAPKDLTTPPANAVKTPTGLQYVILAKTTDAKAKKPTPANTVRVHYSGWTKDGNMFDSSILRERPIEFPLDRVIKGWTEGVSQMSVGDKFRFWVPQNLAYGDNPRPGAPIGDLVFDVELLAIK